MSIFFGVDIGGTSVKTALVSGDGEVLAKEPFETFPDRGYRDLCVRLKKSLEGAVSAAGIDIKQVSAIGVGVPAFIDIEQGVVVEAVNLGWYDVPFQEALQEIAGLPVVLENDANVAALGETWIGGGRGAKTALCVTVGTGVGGGIVIDGKLHRGVNGMAGEIGHLVLMKDGGPQCNCGNRGCLETLASATSIVREAKERQQQGQLPPDANIFGAEDVFKLAQMGHEAAQQVIGTAADWLGYGLALSAVTLNPDRIVIGGGVSTAGEQLLGPVREAFARYALTRTVEAAVVLPAQLGNDAGVIGAARLALQALR